MHVPVLLHEVIEVLDPKPGEFFIDGTVGSGGHAEAMAKRLQLNGMFLGVDWDKDVIRRAESRIKNYELRKRMFVNDNYARLPEILKERKLPRADGLFLDLGFSSYHIEESGRGFSFMKEEMLDMRYRPDSGSMTAREVVSKFNVEKLADIFQRVGEERYARRVAEKIVEARRKKPIRTTFDLTEIIRGVIPYRGRIHPATRVFQALRIYVNEELENLEAILNSLEEVVKPDGRVTIISFHSLEDRLVKNCFRKLKARGRAVLMAKKPIIPSREEIKNNPKSRSAKLRAIKMTL